MTTFPSIAPIYPASKGSTIELSSLQLGDGYKTRYSFSLNNTKPEWKLEWLVDQNSSDAIDLFLQSCADNAEFFQWQPPDSSSELNWKCEEWSIEQQSYNLYSIKATFKRVFELSINQLSGVSTICEEVYCDQNYGTIPILPDLPGAPSVGSTVSIAEPCAGAAYQWKRNGLPILGATQRTYTIIQADYNQNITVAYTCPTYGSPTAETAPIVPVLPPWYYESSWPPVGSNPVEWPDCSTTIEVTVNTETNWEVIYCDNDSLHNAAHGTGTATITLPDVCGFQLLTLYVNDSSGCYSPPAGAYAIGKFYYRKKTSSGWSEPIFWTNIFTGYAASGRQIKIQNTGITTIAIDNVKINGVALTPQNITDIYY